MDATAALAGSKSANSARERLRVARSKFNEATGNGKTASNTAPAGGVDKRSKNRVSPSKAKKATFKKDKDNDKKVASDESPASSPVKQEEAEEHMENFEFGDFEF